MQLKIGFNQFLSSEEWIFSCHELYTSRQSDIEKFDNDSVYSKILILFSKMVQRIGNRLNLRQKVIATGIIYFKRFYVK